MSCWKDDMVITLRVIIDDLSDTPSNSDESLQQILVVAAKLTSEAINFNTDYTISVSPPSITPDPSSDESFVTLVCLKAACLMSRAEQKNRARKGIMIKDGPSNIDGRGAADATARWADTVCADYAKAESSYAAGNGATGQAIIGPYNFTGYYRGIGYSGGRHGPDDTNLS